MQKCSSILIKTLLVVVLFVAFHSPVLGGDALGGDALGGDALGGDALGGDDLAVELTVSGVQAASFSLLPVAGPQAYQPVGEPAHLEPGDTTRVTVAEALLPGEFLLFFEYALHPGQQPQRAEANVFINEQDLQVTINPAFAENPDSVRFQEGERENTIYQRFLNENNEKRRSLEPLQWFVAQYDDTNSELYRLAAETWETRREDYNRWVAAQTEKHDDRFVSTVFPFQQIPPIGTEGSFRDRMMHMLDNYFGDIDFGNERILEVTAFNDWLNGYMNIYGDLVAAEPDRTDELYTRAGRNILEAALDGHPRVCGHLVDYFYQGYEANQIAGGMDLLAAYLEMPGCESHQGERIRQQREAEARLAPGKTAPDFSLQHPGGQTFNLQQDASGEKQTLLLFWSAECGPCEHLLNQMEPWYNEEMANKLDVVAINLDPGDIEIEKYRHYRQMFPEWLHFRPERGFEHPIAYEYHIYATPQMFLLDQDQQIIISTFDLQEVDGKIKN